MSEPCIYCGERSELFCDFLLGFTDPDGDGLFSFEGEHALLRCDAPICLAHATRMGRIHASGKGGFTDTIDHCIGHGGNDDDDRMWPITAGEAQAVRYRHRCGAMPLRLVVRP